MRSSILDNSARHKQIMIEQNEKRNIDTFISEERKTEDNRYSSVDNIRYVNRCNSY